MVVVFGVLIVLGVLMHVIEMIDPTKKKAAPKAAAPVAAAPAAVAAAVAACGGSENVVAVRIAAPSTAWAVGARAEAQTVQPFC